MPIKKRWMSGLGPHEIISAIIWWSHNHVVTVERFERASENGSGQMRTVAVEGDHTLSGTRSEVCKYRSQPRCKTFPFLRCDGRRALRQSRQFFYVRRRAHNYNFRGVQRARECDGVVQEAAIKLGDRFNWKAPS